VDQLSELESVSPEMCTIVAGIGLTNVDMAWEAQVPGTMAYLRRGCAERERSFARDVPHVFGALADINVMGARVLASPSLGYPPADLYSVHDAARSSRVLIFLTHYDSRERLQLGPRMVPLQAVIEAIGAEFDGVVDLSACNTAAPVTVVMRMGSRANWIGYDGEHRLDVRASIVRAVQRVLFAKPAPYIEVFADVIQEFVLQSQELK
jgi:hypothetical protein